MISLQDFMQSFEQQVQNVLKAMADEDGSVTITLDEFAVLIMSTATAIFAKEGLSHDTLIDAVRQACVELDKHKPSRSIVS